MLRLLVWYKFWLLPQVSIGLTADFMLIPRLALGPYRKHEHRVDSRHIAVQRHIAARGAANDEFASAVFHGSPDQRAMGQDLNGIQNFANALGRGAWVKLGDVLKKTVEIVKYFWGQLDAGHASAHLA